MNPAEDTARAKSELRLKARAARRALTPEQRADASKKVAFAILSLPELRDAQAVLSYEPLSEELDLHLAVDGLRQLGIRIALPRITGPRKLQLHWIEPESPLRPSIHGTMEPPPEAPVAPVTAIDIILAPGVAFDRQGGRLGFGAGYYDTLFAELDSSIVRIGIAYEEQMYLELPHDEHDQRVDLVVTPRHVYRRKTN